MVTNLFVRMPSCLSFKGRNYYDGGSRVYASAPMGGVSGVAFKSELEAAPNIASTLAPVVSVRTFFPETWLFDLIETG